MNYSYFRKELHSPSILDTTPSIISKMDRVGIEIEIYFHQFLSLCFHETAAIQDGGNLTVEINSTIPVHVHFFNHIFD